MHASASPDPSGSGRHRLPRVPDQQIAESRKMIHDAAAAVSPGKAIVLGAGRCREIPLAELVRRFSRVVINDIEHLPHAELLAEAGLSAEEASNIAWRTADLTGLTEPLAARWQAILAAETTSAAAADAMLRATATSAPSVEPATEQYDLVVASCVLSQLHNASLATAVRLFAARFPDDAEQFRASQTTAAAFYSLARNMEARFIDSLCALTAPGGRIYLSESVQMCFIEPAGADHWLTEGTLRMTKTTNLADYLDRRFKLERLGRWNWVVNAPQTAGQRGKLFDVQAMILSLA